MAARNRTTNDHDESASLEPEVRSVAALTDGALLADRMSARREIKRIRNAANKGAAPEILRQRLDKLTRRLESSAEILRRRMGPLPDLNVDSQLPIAAKRKELVAAIATHQVVIVSGETGSGKTTQIPKFCLEAGRGTVGTVGVTQPRRIAAITVSRRIAEELGEPLGETVGYKIRFKDTSRSRVRIKVMTDGVLLSEAHGDPFLNHYDTLIVDEAHERSLNIDFILGILKKRLKKRPDLKLVITSATIDTDKFSRAFNHAPVIEVSGRLYPVEVCYAPPEPGDEETSYVDQAARAVDRLVGEHRQGDILIFMPTERDIRDTCELLEGRQLQGTRVIPLFARLSADEQQRVFQPFGGRKIVVATNVAETSITIPGIRYVIDTGLARISQYTPRSRTTTLPVVPISRSSADQRKGRCGRVADGICMRLYDEEDYDRRPQFTPPEIVRANLADVILRMIALKLGEVEDFPFVDPPAPKSIRDGYHLLLELGAIQKNTSKRSRSGPYALTAKGRLMSRLPLDPRLSCMLLEAHERGCLNDVLIIAAALSIQDPRERPLEKQQAADNAHAAFADPVSDFITLQRIWHAYDDILRNRTSWAQVKQFCRTRFLSFVRMREWRDIHQQLKLILAEHGIRSDRPARNPDTPGDLKDSGYADVHRSILSGFLSNIAIKKEKQIFTAAHHRQVMVFPGSGLFKNPGDWIVAAEMVETSRPFARCAAVIDPAWIESLAAGQCTYAYIDPHWEKKRGAVTVTEQVSLYGLMIDRRPKLFGPIDPEAASRIFIRHALIEGDVQNPPAFITYNRQMMAHVEEMENRLRRRDLLVNEHELEAFYQKRLGIIYDLRTLKSRIRKAGGDRFLRMRDKDLLNYSPDPEELAPFPKQIDIGGRRLDCHYQFEPGSEVDGVTVTVPASVAGAVQPETFQWLVPGLLKEKIAALIKALPKQWRKQLVPVTDTAEQIAKTMPAQRNTNLAVALSRFIERHFNIRIPPTAWDETLLPDHLRMRIVITDSKGRTVESSRDTVILKQPGKQRLPDDFQAARQRYERFPIEKWDFGDLPESITLTGPGRNQWTAYPALEARADGVALCAMADRSKARKVHRQGVQALLARHFAQDVKYLRKNLKLPDSSDAAARYFGGRKTLEDQLHQRVLKDTLSENIRTAEAFAEKINHINKIGLAGQGQETRQALIDFISIYQQTRLLMMNLGKPHAPGTPIAVYLEQLRNQLENLVPENFLSFYGRRQLSDVGRYVKALAVRAERGVIDLDKDRRKAEQAVPYERRLAELVQSLGPDASLEKHEAVETLFWMIEEYKISIFAQEVKTAGPVSAKRLDKQIKAIAQMI